uniref:Uncharacterized protein n=1 Tax=Arundo donax TaxID=35708 RepID=A0A0A9BG39_ARUDO
MTLGFAIIWFQKAYPNQFLRHTRPTCYAS